MYFLLFYLTIYKALYRKKTQTLNFDNFILEFLNFSQMVKNINVYHELSFPKQLFILCAHFLTLKISSVVSCRRSYAKQKAD